MSNYQNGKIYKIVCNDTGKEYIGSTTQKYLCKRLAQHKHPSNTSSSREIIDGGNYSMVLVENCPCNSKDELHKRERHFIETLECVNQCIPGRTKKEYREDNKEIYKEWREANKEVLKEKKKEYYEHNKEKIKEYYKANKEKIDEYKKEYRELNKERANEYGKNYREANKEKIKQKQNEKHNCECGGKYTDANKSIHMKTKKHLKYLDSN